MGMVGSWLGKAGVVALAGVSALAGSAAAHDGAGGPRASTAQGAPVAQLPVGCPTAPDPGKMASVEELMTENRRMASFGRRPTASPEHEAFIDWTESRLREIAGLRVGDIGYGVSRWLERSSRLEAGGSSGPLGGVRVANAVPYSKPTSGTSARLVEVPLGTQVEDADVQGKIIVREVATASVPNAVFTALSWWSYDPELELTKTVAGSYERDYLAYEGRLADLRQAAAKGAAGIVFHHGFPHEQIAGHYAPYEGETWQVPALYVGVDEGERLRRLARDGGRARIVLDAEETEAGTRALVATLPGVSDDRIVVTSHTDGMNAVWDNGPIGMLAIARHLAALPQACRPRTIQFVFTTAHLFQQLNPPQRGGSAEELAGDLDHEYDEGKVALTVALEHMGARNFAAVPRGGGRPGRDIVSTGMEEPNSVFIGDSPALIEAMRLSTVRQNVTGTIALRGADLPGLRFPPHRNFGGEGGAYQTALVPTVALVTGPWSLYNPAFGMEAVDGELMRLQTLQFTDFIYSVADLPRELLGGGYLAYREARARMCASGLGTFGMANCPGARKAVKQPPRRGGAGSGRRVVICTSRRRFVVRLPRSRPGRRLRSARVTVNGRRVRVRRAKRWTVVVDLRGTRAKRALVRIAVRTRTGRVLRQTRVYRPCTRRGARS